MNISVRRSEMLDEMGLSPQWHLRETRTVRRVEKEEKAERAEKSSIRVAENLSPNTQEGATKAVLSTEKPPTTERIRSVYVAAQKVEETKKVQPSAPDVFAGLSPAEESQRIQEIFTLDWGALALDSCRACARCQERKNALVGEGSTKASWLFVGESPDATEDERGEGFVGPAGELLDAMLASIDVKRGENVYLTHALKCSAVNKTPETKDMAACEPYLRRQIALLEPTLIVLFGELVAQTLLQERGALENLRGRVFTIHEGEREISVVVTYPPAYLLRNLPDKAKAWEDLCFARRVMASRQSGALNAATVTNG